MTINTLANTHTLKYLILVYFWGHGCSLQGMLSTSSEMRLFAFSQRVRWEDQHHCHVRQRTPTTKLEPGGGQLSLAWGLEEDRKWLAYHFLQSSFIFYSSLLNKYKNQVWGVSLRCQSLCQAKLTISWLQLQEREWLYLPKTTDWTPYTSFIHICNWEITIVFNWEDIFIFSYPCENKNSRTRACALSDITRNIKNEFVPLSLWRHKSR